MNNPASDSPSAIPSPIPPSTELSPAPEAAELAQQNPEANGWSRWFLWCILLALSVPMLFSWGRSEMGRWYQAAALDASYRGDRVMAVERIHQALAWDPRSLGGLFDQASMQLSLGDATAAAATADRVLARSRQEFEARASVPNRMQLASALNMSAYSHALDNTQLEASLAAVNEAFALLESERESGMLDTRGYLHYLLGNYQAALRDTKEAVSLFELTYKTQKAEIRSEARMVIDHLPYRYQLRRLDEGMAVLYQHRGLAYEKLDQSTSAEKDFARAKRLGYDPANGVW